MYSEVDFSNFKQMTLKKIGSLQVYCFPPPPKIIYHYMFSFHVTQSKLIKILDSSLLIHKHFDMCGINQIATLKWGPYSGSLVLGKCILSHHL